MRVNGKKIISALLSTMLGLSIIPITFSSKVVYAAEEKTVSYLGTNGMASPVVSTEAWVGSYVWYGKYDGTPVKYRVLAPKTTVYGGTTILLDCDNTLYDTQFDSTGMGFAKSTAWEYCDLRVGLNGSDFLNKDGVFTSYEKSAIIGSYLGNGSERGNPVNLTGEKIFLLDEDELRNNAYGYYSTEYLSEGAKNREKTSINDSCGYYWWNRTTCEQNKYGNRCGAVYADGRLSDSLVVNSLAVSPAFNVNLKSVIFSSVVAGTAGQVGAEYKLTLQDSNIKSDVTSGEKTSYDGTTVTVPYTISGSDSGNVTQLSVFILDKEYTAGNTNGAKIKYYSRLSTSAAPGTSGSGTFSLPSDISMDKWGTDYQVYLIAEDVNGTYESDYASEPVRLEKPVAKKSGGSSTPEYSNEWVNGKWYDADGKQTYAGTLQWKNNATGWWIEDTSGWYPVNQWQKIDGIWYYFNSSGYMASNEYYKGYWFNADGSWDEQYFLTWKSNSTGWWVEDKSGWWPASSWLKVDGYWYYFNSSGYMVTNQYIDGYWIGADGVCY